MKYILIAFAVGFILSGCATRNTGAPGQGSYTEGSNDRHSINKTSANLRPGSMLGH